MRDGHAQQKIFSAVADFLSHPEQGAISLSGTGAVYRLEKKFAALVGVPHILAVTNATLGLWAVFRALDIHDAEVVTTPYTWGGSLTGVLLTGNRPVFADIDPQTLTLDPDALVRCITPKTKAILAVDIYGHPCDGEALRTIANRHGLVLIQDCAQSFGASIGGQHTGFWADAAVFSFTWGKALYAGEGGMVVTRSPELLDRLVRDTQHPLRQLRDVPDLSINEMALNLRIHPVAAVWADAAFADALEGVSTHRGTCIQILKFLQEQHLSRTKVPNLKKVQPSFQALTFEPCAEESEIHRTLEGNGWSAHLSLPTITEPIYQHASYRELASAKGWGEPDPCPVAERQCTWRIRLTYAAADHANCLDVTKEREGVVGNTRDEAGE